MFGYFIRLQAKNTADYQILLELRFSLVPPFPFTILLENTAYEMNGCKIAEYRPCVRLNELYIKTSEGLSSIISTRSMQDRLQSDYTKAQ